MDTRAAVTIVSNYFFEAIPESKRPKLGNPDVQYLIFADDSWMKIRGVATCTFKAESHFFFLMKCVC